MILSFFLSYCQKTKAGDGDYDQGIHYNWDKACPWNIYIPNSSGGLDVNCPMGQLIFVFGWIFGCFVSRDVLYLKRGPGPRPTYWRWYWAMFTTSLATFTMPLAKYLLKFISNHHTKFIKAHFRNGHLFFIAGKVPVFAGQAFKRHTSDNQYTKMAMLA